MELNKDFKKIDERSLERSQTSGKYFETRVSECEDEARAHDETAERIVDNPRRADFYRQLAADYRVMAAKNRERVAKYTEEAQQNQKDIDADVKAASAAMHELGEKHKAFASSPERKERLARSAAAAAFLVGQGYHSAMEVAEGVLRYDGQSLRKALEADKDTYKNQDAGDLLHAGAATHLIMELLQEQTQEDER